MLLVLNKINQIKSKNYIRYDLSITKKKNITEKKKIFAKY